MKDRIRDLLTAGVLEETEEGFVIPLASFGDYDNSCAVERANQRVLLEEFAPPLYVNYGSFGGKQAILPKDFVKIMMADGEEELAEDLLETLEGLAQYPALDDEVVSEVEEEMFREAWSDFGAVDFDDALDDDVDRSDLWALWLRYAEPGRDYFVEAGGSVYFDIDRVVGKIKEDR